MLETFCMSNVGIAEPLILSWWPETGTNCDTQLGIKPALQFLKIQPRHVQMLFKYDQGTYKWRRLTLTSLCRTLHFGQPFIAGISRLSRSRLSRNSLFPD